MRNYFVVIFDGFCSNEISGKERRFRGISCEISCNKNLSEYSFVSNNFVSEVFLHRKVLYDALCHVKKATESVIRVAARCRKTLFKLS